jgi:hypothetical protein
LTLYFESDSEDKTVTKTLSVTISITNPCDAPDITANEMSIDDQEATIDAAFGNTLEDEGSVLYTLKPFTISPLQCVYTYSISNV